MKKKTTAKNQPNYAVPGLERGLEILEALSRDKRPATVAELTKRLDLPRSSVFRILYTLERKGYVETDASGKAYALGPGVLRLGYQHLASRDVVQVARAEVEDLARRTGVSAHLAVRDGRAIVYLIHAPGNANFVSNIGVGDRLPAHATPMGQLLLSELSRDELSALYEDVTPESLTAQTPRTPGKIAKAVESAAAAGHVISHGAVHAGGKSLAAPIYDAVGKMVAAIDISGPDVAFATNQIETRYLKEVVKTALAISSRLGYSGKTLARIK
jgi:DNA-binding IclR family transcriptional regulator